MESIVFANSPLAEYLEGNGQNEADWGIEPVDSSLDRLDLASRQFAPTLSTTTRSQTNVIEGLKPLLLGHTGSWRNLRLCQTVYRIVDGRLSRSENARFIERFRYIIIASQLLNGHVNVSHYDRKAETDQLFPEQDAGAKAGSQYGKAQYWMGSGGFVLVASLLLPWVFRGGTGRMGMSKGKAIVSLVISVVFVIFLFTHARRRWLRSLRSRTIELAAMFVQNSQMFDILASNAVTLIQEVELVSRGYRLSAPLPPISRLEHKNQARRCSKLRKSISSALHLAIPPHMQACISLRSFVRDGDMEKYYDIYDIQNGDLEEAEIGIDSDQFDDRESLKALKTLLHRLHTTRRVFLCHLLAIDAEGGHADYAKWNLAAELLHTLGRITGELAAEVKEKLGEEEQFNVPPSPRTPLSPENERHRGQLRKLNSLSQALRGSQAKMHVLREESDRTLRESTDETGEFGSDLLSHYDSVGSDLHALVGEWESGRSYLAMSLDRQDRSSPPPPESISGITLVSDTPRNSELFDKDHGSWADAVGLGTLSASDERDDDHDDEEAVYEAVAEPRPRSIMTREERIKKVQEERAITADKRKKAEAGLALQKELQEVLVNRPPPQRRSINRSFSR